MTDALRLWGFRLSPFVGKVRAALMEKGVEAELVGIKPTDRPARLRELNPVNKVPVLELPDGTAIRESTVICEWLDEVYPDPPLWPADPGLRAWARGWLKYVDDLLTAPFFRGMGALAFTTPEDPAAIEADIAKHLSKGWVELEKALAHHDGPWLCGEQFTLADLGGLALAARLPEWRPDLVPDAAAYPLITAWFEELRARPSAPAIDQRATVTA